MIVDAWLVIAQGSHGLDESDGSVGANASYRFDGLDGLDNAEGSHGSDDPCFRKT